MTGTCIVVLGMNRSGTSLIAGILYRLGVNMGTAFRKPDRHNATGYYEDLDFRDLNKAIINRAGGRWYNPPNPEDVTDSIIYHEDAIRELIGTRSGIWGFKDPRTIFTIHALEPYLPDDIRFIRVIRNPIDIVGSLFKRATLRDYKRTHTHWYALMKRYDDRLSDYLRDSIRPVITVEYGDFYSDAFGTVQKLARFCDLDWRDEELIEYAVALIMPRKE